MNHIFVWRLEDMFTILFISVIILLVVFIFIHSLYIYLKRLLFRKRNG